MNTTAIITAPPPSPETRRKARTGRPARTRASNLCRDARRDPATDRLRRGGGPTVVLPAAPWLLFALLVAGPALRLFAAVIVLIVAALFVVALAAIATTPYLLIRRLRVIPARRATSRVVVQQLPAGPVAPEQGQRDRARPHAAWSLRRARRPRARRVPCAGSRVEGVRPPCRRIRTRGSRWPRATYSS
jgi:hypothetical protein